MNIIVKKNVSISKIFARQDFDINFPFYSSALEGSIHRAGIITPLAAFEENGNYILIDGFQRLRIAEKSGLKEIPLFLYEAAYDPQARIRLRYELLKSSTEELNILQKARILNLVDTYLPHKGDQNKWTQILKLPKNSGVKKLLSWPLSAQEYLIKYSVSYNQIKPFLNYNGNDIKTLFELAAELSMRPVEFLKLSELLYESALNNKKSIKDILNNEEIIGILQNEKMNRNQKIARLKDIIYLRRFPFISQYRRNMDDLLKKLNNKTFSVAYDKTFERSELSVSAVIKSESDIENLYSALTDKETKKILLEMLKKI